MSYIKATYVQIMTTGHIHGTLGNKFVKRLQSVTVENHNREEKHDNLCQLLHIKYLFSFSIYLLRNNIYNVMGNLGNEITERYQLCSFHRKQLFANIFLR